MRKKYFKTKKGFTIIETMVAISLFLVIVMAGMGALLNANLLHQKSQSTRSILDNLSFIMEDMSRNLRTGYNYRCYDVPGTITSNNISITDSCDNEDGWGIAFEQQNGILYDNPPINTDYHDEDQWAYYIGNDKKIYRSSAEDALDFIPLTPDEVEIDVANSSFKVTGALKGSADNLQPFVTIKLVGKITLKGVESPFSLQTSVSQRKIDIYE